MLARPCGFTPVTPSTIRWAASTTKVTLPEEIGASFAAFSTLAVNVTFAPVTAVGNDVCKLVMEATFAWDAAGAAPVTLSRVRPSRSSRSCRAGAGRRCEFRLQNRARDDITPSAEYDDEIGGARMPERFGSIRTHDRASRFGGCRSTNTGRSRAFRVPGNASVVVPARTAATTTFPRIRRRRSSAVAGSPEAARSR